MTAAPLTRDQLAAMVYAAFPGDPRMAEHVVWAESMGDWATGDKNVNGVTDWIDYVYGGVFSVTGDCGLLQTNRIHAGKYEALGYDWPAACFDPSANLAVAQIIYDTQGPQAWSSY